MKKYGLIVADNGSDLFVSGTFDLRWDNDLLNPAFHALHAEDFEVVLLGWDPSGPGRSLLRDRSILDLGPPRPALAAILPLHPRTHLYRSGVLPGFLDPEAPVADRMHPLYLYALDAGTLHLVRAAGDTVAIEY
jgi:hypothetical protein